MRYLPIILNVVVALSMRSDIGRRRRRSHDIDNYST